MNNSLDYEVDSKRETARLLHGNISNYKKTRSSKDFMFTDADRRHMGAAAAGAALVGLGGIAVGLASSAIDTSERADLLEFDLGTKQVRAWVWKSVFSEGDEVEVVAEPIGDRWQAYAIRRTRDEIVSMHPHCSRGRVAHYKKAFRMTCLVVVVNLVISYIICAILMIVKGRRDWLDFLVVGSVGGFFVFIICLFMAYRMARRYMGFVYLSEKIFNIFGWRGVKNIDLPAITKRNKMPNDPGDLGVLYFRVPSGEVGG